MMDCNCFIGIIPARYASTRFPGKPLAKINGKSMIQRVYEQVSLVLDDVYVATDDNRIFTEVIQFGGKAVITSELHKSGTDRCFEAYTLTNSDKKVIINIQGDEPNVEHSQIETLISCFVDGATQIATLKKQILSKEELFSPNVVKVVCNSSGEAVYFSRCPIPYMRGCEQEQWLQKQKCSKHIGIYAYKTDVLMKIAQLQQSNLELSV